MVAGLVAAALTLGLYLATAARDIVVGDPTEFVIVSLTGGIAHPPGYPLLSALGQAFGALPLGPAPFRIGLISTVAGAAAAGLVAVTALRLGASGVAAVIGALAFATTSVVWRWSVVPEAFALNDAIVAGILLAMVVWHRRPTSATPVIAGSFLGGLALANHQTAALIAPAVAIALWQERDAIRRRPGLLALGALAFAIGLVPYAYVFAASAAQPAWSWGPVAGPADLWRLVSRDVYGGGQLVSEAAVAGGDPFRRVWLLVLSYWPVGLAALAGAVAALDRERWWLTRTGAAFIVAGPAFVAYANIDPTGPVNRVVLERFFLLPHVITAPLIALGITGVAAAVTDRLRRPLAQPVVLGAAAALVIALAVVTYPLADRRTDRVARGYSLDILESVEPGTILLTNGDDSSTGVAYLQLVEGTRRDVVHVAAPLLRADWYTRQLRARHPGVAFPFDRLGVDGDLRRFIQANPDRTFAVVGGLVDDSLRETHWLSTRGLVSILKPLPASGSVDDLARENDRVMFRYHVPSAADVRGRPWEQAILGDYAFPAFLVGQQYEIARQYAQARAWYSRALAIDPQMARAREALARLPRS